MFPELSSLQKKNLLVTQKRISKTIGENKIIVEGDKVLVGLSGGKDSYVMLHALSQIRTRLPFKFHLGAVHINAQNIPFDRDYDYMRQLCNELNVPFEIIEIDIDLQTDKKLSTCFKCSWNRRTALFQFASRNQYNKIAFGHHLDDAVETLLMNMFYNGEISAMPYEVEMFKNRFKIIRPMLDIQHEYIIDYATTLGFMREKYKCEYSQVSKRDYVRNLLEEITKQNPDIAKNIFRSMKKIVPEYLPKRH